MCPSFTAEFESPIVLRVNSRSPTSADGRVSCACVYVGVQVGVSVQLIQVITMYREAVATQIAK